ncbi:glycoside hydrolase family 16 protein [Naumannella halotolerans]|uniref:Beta-glucanase (GH16 family) n=1 Tax=Naumannella halotolerans TaxID=993414 RepID=A0A4R7J8C7_9ACTN|nr:glycoside hydrolase family 16 protein [Naumannella halotolerans]TDT33036.1 beta-glucanase (GH16 family) [Naumannella halotolerans]
MRRRKFILGAGALGVVALGGSLAFAGGLGEFNGSSVPDIDGWDCDFADEFDADHLDRSIWESYGWGHQTPTGGGMGRYLMANTTISDGMMRLRYGYDDGEWTCAGVSSAPTFDAVGGRWEFRVRHPRAHGIGYAFLLWPQDQIWPPEVNIAEGNCSRKRVEQFFHYGVVPNQKRENREITVGDPHDWNTFGVIIDEDALRYTHNGEVVQTIPLDTADKRVILTERIWIGFQMAPMDENAPEAEWFDTVDGGVPNSETPPEGYIDIDWVAHYVRK